MSRHTHESNLQHSVGEKILNLIFLHTRHTRKSEWNFKFSKFIPGRHIIMKIPARFRGELDTILILTIARGQQTHSTQWCSWHGGACLMWWLFLYFKTSKKIVCMWASRKNGDDLLHILISFEVSSVLVVLLCALQRSHCLCGRVGEREWSMLIVVCKNNIFSTWIINRSEGPFFIFEWTCHRHDDGIRLALCAVNPWQQRAGRRWKMIFNFQLLRRRAHCCARN